MDNVFICVLRIGAMQLGKDDEGLTFFEILNRLEALGYKKPEDGSTLKLSLFRWWLACSTTREINEDQTSFQNILNEDTNKPWDERRTIPMHLNIKKRHLKAEMLLKLIDYEALQEARASSKKSISVAIWAIGITALLALTSIIVQIYSILY